MGRATNHQLNPMTIEIFIVESDEVKVSKTLVVEKAKAPSIDLQKMVDEAYEILREEMRNEAQRLTQHNN